MNKYLRAVSSNYVFFFINAIFFLSITPIAIRVMGEELYGLWAILNAILLFSGVGILSMGVVVNKFAAEDGENALHINSVISTAIFILLPMSIFVMILILVLRNWISAQFGLAEAQQIQVQTALGFTALSVVPQFLGRIPYGYLFSQLKNNLARMVETCTYIATWSGAVVIAFYTASLSNIALWNLIVQFFGTVVLFVLVLPRIHFRWRFEQKAFRTMLSFSGFSFLETLASGIFQNFDRLVVGSILGASAAGIYSVATSVGLRLIIITGQITDVMVPYASLKHSTDKQSELYITFQRVSHLVSLLLGILASFLIIWMDTILSFWISYEYAKSYTNIFRIIIIAYLVISMSRIGQQTLTGIGNIKVVSIIYFISSILMLGGIKLLSNPFGLEGAAYANLFMITLISFNLIVYKHLPIQNSWRSVFQDIGFALGLPVLTYHFVVRYTNIYALIIASIAILILAAINLKIHNAYPFLQKMVKRFRNPSI
mgnify:CR=1 FL=1